MCGSALYINNIYAREKQERVQKIPPTTSELFGSGNVLFVGFSILEGLKIRTISGLLQLVGFQNIAIWALESVLPLKK